MTQTTNDKLSIEFLFRAAFDRTKERFWNYIVIMILYILMTLGAGLAAALLAGLNFLIFTATQSVEVTTTTAIISIVGAVLGFIYLGSWGTLAMVHVLISKEKIGATASFKEVKPLVWNYTIFTLLVSVFFIGLVPISLPTLFILLFVWSIFAVFSVFVYMEKKEKGLQNLWISKAIVSQNFWGILGRLVLLYAIIWAISFGLNSLSEESGIFTLLSVIFSIVVSPFSMSYAYEIYKNVPHPDKVPAQKVWIIISAIGWVLLILGIISMGSTLMQLKDNPEIKDIIEKEMMQQKVDSI